MAAALGDSLLAKAVSSAVSVVKANHVQGGAATNHVRRELSIIFCGYQRPFLDIDLLPFCWTIRLEK